MAVSASRNHVRNTRAARSAHETQVAVVVSLQKKAASASWLATWAIFDCRGESPLATAAVFLMPSQGSQGSPVALSHREGGSRCPFGYGLQPGGSALHGQL